MTTNKTHIVFADDDSPDDFTKNESDALDQLIRLKVNRQIYDGQLDPSGHRIRLIPVQLVPVKYY